MSRPNRRRGVLLALAGVLTIAACTERRERPRREYVLRYETNEPADHTLKSPVEAR